MNKITGGEGFWAWVGIICLFIFMPKWVFFVALGLLVFGVVLAIWLSPAMPACPSCGSKAGTVFRYSKVGGGPDLRYNSNPLVCVTCRKSSADIASDLSRLTSRSSVEEASKVISCEYIVQPGIRYFSDCPNFPKGRGEKCKRCWVVNDSEVVNDSVSSNVAPVLVPVLAADQVVCPHCKKSSTIPHYGGHWCSNCGRFASPPDPELLPSNQKDCKES